jgi:hypothetical protein
MALPVHVSVVQVAVAERDDVPPPLGIFIDPLDSQKKHIVDLCLGFRVEDLSSVGGVQC